MQDDHGTGYGDIQRTDQDLQEQDPEYRKEVGGTAGGRSGSLQTVFHGRLFSGRDRENEGRVAEHHFKEAASHPEDSDGDVQK